MLDALANNDGLPALEAIVCIDMKGLRHYRQQQLMSFETLCQLGEAYARENPDANATLDRLISQASPDDVCILVYTSGTTGPPKGAMLTHRNLVYAAYVYAETVGIADKPFEAVSYLPLCHVAERCYGEVMHLVLGGTVSFAESIDTVAAQHPRDRADILRRRAPHLRKAAAGFSVQARRERPVAAALSSRPASPGPQAVGPPADRDRRRLLDRARLRAALRRACSATSSAISASPAAVTGSAPAHRSRRKRCASSTSSAARSRKATA